MTHRLLTVEIRFDSDVVSVRQRGRQVAALLGFDELEQARIATAVSEIARNAFQYANGGRVEFCVHDSPDRIPLLAISVIDQGPGIRDLEGILEGRFQSRTGAGRGLVSAKRLMDHFHVEAAPGEGTRVLLSKRFPRQRPALTARELAHVSSELARQRSEDPLDELRRQNQDLLRAMDELRARQDELLRLNRELEDTNRGVVALYAELDDKAMHLRRADELKSRFLSNMSHEFRTPLNSILALSRLLLGRVDGDLTDEQARQLSFVHKSAQDLSELVDDLLDLAKVEAGRITVKPSEVDVQNVFAGLRGMFRPLLANPLVNLVFDEPSGVPKLYTDEGKVSQILRNYISNALKFTERGQVTVSARYDPHANTVTLSVSDTGIGIPPEHQERIFEEFAQVDSPIQRTVRGTGLGLPLAKRFTELLGGQVGLVSRPGAGSTFSSTIPVSFAGAQAAAGERRQVDSTRHSVLVVEDDAETVLLYEKYLRGTGFQVIPAATVAEARRHLAEFRPAAIVLDLVLPGGGGWDFISELKSSSTWHDIPVYVVSVVEDRNRGLRLGADEYFIKPLDRRKLLERLRAGLRGRSAPKILVIDDDDVSRYLLRDLLADTVYQVIEASGGVEGVRLALEQHPAAILLDLLMPDASGFEVLDRLAASDATREIPVIIVTSKALTEEERAWLSKKTVAILSKESASRQEAIAKLRDALTSAQASPHAP